MLPFVVEPRQKPIVEVVGTEESGKIEIERRGYLTTGEKAFTQQMKQFDDGSNEIVTVSRNIARKFSMGMDKAYQLVLKIISATEAETPAEAETIDKIEKEFAEALTGVVKGLAMGQVKEELIFAACLIRYRVDLDFDIASVGSLHPELIEALAALYRDEEARSLDAFAASLPEAESEAEKEPSIEEAEKKPAKPSRTRSKSTTGA
jgi:hypothetical protein